MRIRALAAVAGLMVCLAPAGAAGSDTDGDGVPDSVDNCPDVFNPDQRDVDTAGAFTTSLVSDQTIGAPQGRIRQVLRLGPSSGGAGSNAAQGSHREPWTLGTCATRGSLS
jgi:hypothetical protein